MSACHAFVETFSPLYLPPAAVLPHTMPSCLPCTLRNKHQQQSFNRLIAAEQRINSDWYTGRWWVGCYIWYSEDGPAWAAASPSPLLAVPNVTAHPSTASVSTSYYSMWYNIHLYSPKKNYKVIAKHINSRLQYNKLTIIISLSLFTTRMVDKKYT